MAGTVITDVVQSSISGTPPQFNDSNGTQTGTLCRAWVNFNGTGTIAIRASFNVSSITDNGTGNYTVNFTNALTDANYSTVFTGTGKFGTVGGNAMGVPIVGASISSTTETINNTTALVQIQFVQANAGGSLDPVQANVAVFR